MKKKIYIETTIPSFYYEIREEAEMVARRNWSREWWDNYRNNQVIKYKVMPNDPIGDALHLALASYYKCDFLLTWNCDHLANANKFNHIRRINTMLGLFVPNLVMPLELLSMEDI